MGEAQRTLRAPRRTDELTTYWKTWELRNLYNFHKLLALNYKWEWHSLNFVEKTFADGYQTLKFARFPIVAMFRNKETEHTWPRPPFSDCPN